MKLKPLDVEKLERFLEKTRKDVYPEPPTKVHTDMTKKMLDQFLGKYPLRPDSRILDVGCGQGVALELFTRQGFSPVGITLDSQDLAVCKQKGFEVYEMDQSFLDFGDQLFNLVWCRHCLEHSIFPLFTLSELFRVLRCKGYLYVEVPAPDTVCKHQTNKNHYSVLGKSMWAELLRRTGFHIVDVFDIHIHRQQGTDVHWVFIEQKPSPSEESF